MEKAQLMRTRTRSMMEQELAAAESPRSSILRRLMGSLKSLMLAPATDRRWEVDLLRGVAILMMISFHFLFDLNYLGLYDIDVYEGALGLFGYSIGTLFLLLVGVSLTLSYRRAAKAGMDESIWKKYATRGAEVFSLGMFVTAATLVYPGRGFVAFGILHCIGISIVLGFAFVRFRWPSLVLGAGVIAAGVLVIHRTFDFPWLLWLGLAPEGFNTLDYFPLVPWLGVVLLGISVGNILYWRVPDASDVKSGTIPRHLRTICLIGRRALIIYLLHQPVLFSILYLLSIV